MATISENLQIIADSTAAIKQAIIDKGGDVTGDISTWAEAISGLSGGSSGSSEEKNNPKFVINTGSNISQDIIDNNISLYNFLINKYGATGGESIPTIITDDTPKIFSSGFPEVKGQCIYIYIPTSLSYIYLYDANGLSSYFCVYLTSDGRALSVFYD